MTESASHLRVHRGNACVLRVCLKSASQHHGRRHVEACKGLLARMDASPNLSCRRIRERESRLLSRSL